MRTKHNLYIGDRTAEKIKIEVGSVSENLDEPPEDMHVQGRDLLSGKPKEKIISYIEVSKAVDKSIIRIEDSIMETLSQTPPELAADIYNTGIYLAGGGALLRGLDKRLSLKTKHVYLCTLFQHPQICPFNFFLIKVASIHNGYPIFGRLEYRVYNVLSVGTDFDAILPNLCSQKHNKVPCALAWAYFLLCYVDLRSKP